MGRIALRESPFNDAVARAIVTNDPVAWRERVGLVDYILFGAGTGASLAVIGWVLREWGPALRDGRSEDGLIHSASELVDRMSWARFCASCGMALVFGGTLILFVTGIVAIWNPGDTLAARILIGTYLGVSLLLLAWSGLYTRQFGTSGIYRPAPPKPVTEPTSTVEATDSDAPATAAGDEPAETAASTDEERDIESVAASRGGLGRFAAFFNRGKSADDAPANEVDSSSDAESIDAGVEVDEQAIVGNDGAGSEDDTAESSPIESGVVEVIEVDQVSVDDAGVVEEIDEVIVVESSASDQSDNPTEQSGSGQDDSGADDGPTADAASSEESGEGTQVGLDAAGTDAATEGTPEDTALAELRRRRLARLSGNDPTRS